MTTTELRQLRERIARAEGLTGSWYGDSFLLDFDSRHKAGTIRYTPDLDPAWVLRAMTELHEDGYQLLPTATLNPIRYRYVNAMPTKYRPDLCDWQPTIALATTYAWAAMKENA